MPKADRKSDLAVISLAGNFGRGLCDNACGSLASPPREIGALAGMAQGEGMRSDQRFEDVEVTCTERQSVSRRCRSG